MRGKRLITSTAGDSQAHPKYFFRSRLVTRKVAVKNPWLNILTNITGFAFLTMHRFHHRGSQIMNPEPRRFNNRQIVTYGLGSCGELSILYAKVTSALPRTRRSWGILKHQPRKGIVTAIAHRILTYPQAGSRYHSVHMLNRLSL